MNKYENLLKQFKEDIIKVRSVDFNNDTLLKDIENQIINIYRLKLETM